MPRRGKLVARRRTMGFTQEALAEALTLRRTDGVQAPVATSTVASWEQGTSAPRPWWRRPLAAELNVSLGELDELLALDDDAPPAPAPTAHGRAVQVVEPAEVEALTPTVAAGEGIIAVPCLTPDGRIAWVSVPRRKFLLGGMVSAMVAAVGAPTPRSSGTAPSGKGAKPVKHFCQMRRVLMDSDNIFGPRRVIPAVHEQIVSMGELRKSLGSTDRRELLEVQVQFADLCGWLHQDSGNHRDAQYWLDRALEWSHATGDADTVAFILARKSQLAADMQDPNEAVDVAEAAISTARPRGRVAAVAANYAAHGHALRGDKAACRRCYDDAYGRLGRIDDDPDAWYGLFLDPAYVDVQRAHSLAVLGDYGPAVDAFQSAITAMPADYYRDRGVYLAREAVAYAGTSDTDQTSAIGLQALAIGVETGSERIMAALFQADHMLTQQHRGPATEFQEAIATLRD